jgi:general secretion pathway protein D
VPILKDIPLLGNLFRSVNHSNDRTELIVLITPYVVNDDFDAQAITNAFRKQLGDWAGPPPSPAAGAPEGGSKP